MPAETEEEHPETVLGNGDTLAERLEAVDLSEDDTCTTEEMRERLGL